jgi:outer membrane lipoprotein-sorting protein
MKRSAVIVLVALFVLSCVSVFAGSAPASGSTKPHSTHVSGEVVSVDTTSNSFVIRETLKDKSNKEITIVCAPGTKITMASKTATLSQLAAGDHVTVSYASSADGKNMATSVSIAKPHSEQPASKS